MQWLDDMKQEIAYARNAIDNWWSDEDNEFATWLIAGTTAVVALCVYGGLFFGGRAAFMALTEETTITVVNGNRCLTNKGLVKALAPAECYESGAAHQLVPRQNDASFFPPSGKPADPVYNPPCFKDGKPGCTDQIYAKRLVEGEIFTATFNSDEKTVTNDHLQPDFTEVKFLALLDDQVAPDNEKFCGNVLNRFTPGKKFRMVINESKQSDYNGCYLIDVITFTFGGDPYATRIGDRQGRRGSSVPGVNQ